MIGTGYVGLITAVGLSDFGNHVVGADVDVDKIDMLKNGISPIYEPGVETYLKKNLENGKLEFTTNIDSAIQNSDIIFIAVGTPSDENGCSDLKYIYSVADSISKNINSYKIIVTKSTVPVGTNKKLKEYIKNKSGTDNFDIISNPEFLREGRAIQDFFHPDRVVIGYESEKLGLKKKMEEIYRPLYLIQTPMVFCNFETAELIKYASNAFLATKITFINQIANLSEEVGADIHILAKTLGMDGRISPKFLHPGPGYGGSCFPKDTKALVNIGNEYGINMSLISEVISSNEYQKIRVVEKSEKILGELKSKTISILGLSFKSGTDDIRDSPSITIINKLLEKGAKIAVSDPQALENISKIFGNKINYFVNEYDAVKDSELVIILTEWNEYRNIDLTKIKTLMKGNTLLDTRNILNPDDVKAIGLNYIGTGRK
ncbi:UDP-glucose/GDP-mannose dehydrogenase family protein [Methanococcus maripaludis]|uniref:UDP-glucose 6-dehydrogenase n=1 Tax=Methanococcus maripaludis TaxID=39152 RepID=A0A7J9P9I2_METMI|nr:UDP-glucose/GDP-mannose dehydrogenase family protein [Methanococcus maripaludis]MBA2859852.1 UDPglucose 6-dehydrogenase [Methanococcus maripaludis]